MKFCRKISNPITVYAMKLHAMINYYPLRKRGSGKL